MFEKYMKQLEDCKYLYLEELFEPNTNELVIILTEGRVAEEITDIIIGEQKIENVKEVKIDVNSKRFKVYFSSYISYSVINESYTTLDEYEEFEGHNFRVYSKSRFLDYVSKGTIATKDYPGPFIHYGLCCCDHIIEILSTKKPTITET